MLIASGCGSSGSDDATTPPAPDPAESSTWGEMKWGEGTWDK